MISVNSKRLLRTIDELAQIGATKEGGVTRLCLSPQDVEARKYVINLMSKAGLEVHIDSVANVIGVLNSSNPEPVIAAGSHIDTVINGGHYDGSYGVLAAIEALQSLRESETKCRHPIAAVSFTNEEGVRFPAMAGSKYVAGEVTKADVLAMKGTDGSIFRDMLNQSGLECEDGSFLLTHRPGAYLELHIEQGPTLENRGIQIGLVDRIVGTRQTKVVIQGSADHAGTTPMSVRKDALLAASHLIQHVNALAFKIGKESVGTVGFVRVNPNAPNVVPGEVELVVDFRSGSSETIDLASTRINDAAGRIAKDFGVRIDIQERAYLPPARMADSVMREAEQAVSELGYNSCRMQSGAGHDAMIMSRIAETGVIFVPSISGKSHSPLENTDPEDLIRGANVLTTTLQRLAA